MNGFHLECQYKITTSVIADDILKYSMGQNKLPLLFSYYASIQKPNWWFHSTEQEVDGNYTEYCLVGTPYYKPVG